MAWHLSQEKHWLHTRVPEFKKRGDVASKEGRYLDAAGNYLVSGLNAMSMIPVVGNFRCRFVRRRSKVTRQRHTSSKTVRRHGRWWTNCHS
jgi:hypothetical protein